MNINTSNNEPVIRSVESIVVEGEDETIETQVSPTMKQAPATAVQHQQPPLVNNHNNNHISESSSPPLSSQEEEGQQQEKQQQQQQPQQQPLRSSAVLLGGGDNSKMPSSSPGGGLEEDDPHQERREPPPLPPPSPRATTTNTSSLFPPPSPQNKAEMRGMIRFMVHEQLKAAQASFTKMAEEAAAKASHNANQQQQEETTARAANERQQQEELQLLAEERMKAELDKRDDEITALKNELAETKADLWTLQEAQTKREESTNEHRLIAKINAFWAMSTQLENRMQTQFREHQDKLGVVRDECQTVADTVMEKMVDTWDGQFEELINYVRHTLEDQKIVQEQYADQLQEMRESQGVLSCKLESVSKAWEMKMNHFTKWIQEPLADERNLLETMKEDIQQELNQSMVEWTETLETLNREIEANSQILAGFTKRHNITGELLEKQAAESSTYLESTRSNQAKVRALYSEMEAERDGWHKEADYRAKKLQEWRDQFHDLSHKAQQQAAQLKATQEQMHIAQQQCEEAKDQAETNKKGCEEAKSEADKNKNKLDRALDELNTLNEKLQASQSELEKFRKEQLRSKKFKASFGLRKEKFDQLFADEKTGPRTSTAGSASPPQDKVVSNSKQEETGDEANEL